ncbi:Dabb family protein [Nocardia iowensis]|uniref:Dabb family protein n=1 Tax=Nocardia iowensis TaxID=204891 RepID=A0ABX8RGT7_NOCIO|nr:Dabb family protein [Nocardia iowensis]QXN88571.1 Dabb family protein [Nocardia iowensis]
MIYHGNRIKLRQGVTQEQAEAALASLDEQGRIIPAVQSFIAGREYGSDFDWGAIFVLADLDAYWAYLSHPAHTESVRIGLPLAEKFQTYDLTDDPDPDFESKVAQLQKRHFDSAPEIAKLLTALPAHTGISALPHPE